MRECQNIDLTGGGGGGLPVSFSKGERVFRARSKYIPLCMFVYRYRTGIAGIDSSLLFYFEARLEL
jgi:hypothetical protein